MAVKKYLDSTGLATLWEKIKALIPTIATSSKAGIVKSGGDITVTSDGVVSVNNRLRQIIIPSVDSSNSVHYVKIASVNLTTTQGNSAQAIISGTGGVGYIMKDIAVVLISARNDSGTEYIRLLKINKNSSNWSLGCGYVKGTSIIDFYITISRYNGYKSRLIPLAEDDGRDASISATFLNTLTATTTKPSGWVDGSVGSVFSDFNKPTLDIADLADSDVTDNTLLLTSRVDGTATNTTIHKRPATYLWNYVKGKIESVLGLTASKYNGTANSITRVSVGRQNGGKYTLIGEINIPYKTWNMGVLSLKLNGGEYQVRDRFYEYNVEFVTNSTYTASVLIMKSESSHYDNILYGELIQPTSSSVGKLYLYLDLSVAPYASYSIVKLLDSVSFKINDGTKYDDYINHGGTRITPSEKNIKRNKFNGIFDPGNTSNNWNNLTLAGCYKIQGTALTAQNSPNSSIALSYGILVVERSEDGGENRLIQIYYSDYYNEKGNYRLVCYRTCNEGEWRAWIPLVTKPYADNTYHKINDVLEITDSNLSTYYNASTEILSGIPKEVGTIVFTTTNQYKISAIQVTDVFNGKRIALVGNYIPSESYAHTTTSGRFSQYLYEHRYGEHGLGDSNAPVEFYEDFIYFNGIWYSKGY